LWFFDVVPVHIERPPRVITRFGIQRFSAKTAVAAFSSAKFGVVVLRVRKRYAIAAAGHQRKTQLRKIVFPQADLATFVITGLARKHPVTTTRTGIEAGLHDKLRIRVSAGGENWLRKTMGRLPAPLFSEE
jgi:hypothetical protein